jgi:DNA polymerase
VNDQPNNMTREELGRQVRQQLLSWQAAGVEWLPKAGDLPFQMPDEHDTAQVPSAASATGSLFEAAEEHSAISQEQRLIELTQVAEQVAGCTRCPELASTRTQTVFGTGPIDAELCFIGEAPGADEDRQGFPFVGAAGQLLTKIISAMGMKREDVYIMNILRCRPPGNRVPKVDEARNCREYLDRQLDLIKPKFICTLGATAAQNLLGTSMGIGKLRGKFHDYRGIPVICTYHPASLLPSRSPENKKLVWEDMKMLLQRMGKPIPGKS